ncbi:hypothetical protein [Marinilabilia sp.]|uniref:hypothetical protein n=1 Tax=Marinilabilia sp. TaxID=2021252 RepID=UPI0025BEC75E|nr:hypothetical protein [Marinilabilia sp.]
MRNYSEIGCLTLLGVTLTVYVAVGNCQPDQNPYDWSSKNINAEEVERAIKQGSEKHYFVKVSTQALSQNGTKKSLAGIPALGLAGVADSSADSVLPVNSFFLSLPSFPSRTTCYDFPGIILDFCEGFDYHNPASILHLEIRAGPCQA